MKEEECYLNEKPFNRCCCNCKQQIPLKPHPWLKWVKLKYICIAGLDSGVVTPSNEHCCGCELYIKKEIK